MEENNLISPSMKKSLMLIGLAQLVAEYIEDISEDPQFNAIFVRKLKFTANRFRDEALKHTNKITAINDSDINEQTHDIYICMSKLLENHIVWPDGTTGLTEPSREVEEAGV
jgi:hypothetical protein